MLDDDLVGVSIAGGTQTTFACGQPLEGLVSLSGTLHHTNFFLDCLLTVRSLYMNIRRCLYAFMVYRSSVSQGYCPSLIRKYLISYLFGESGKGNWARQAVGSEVSISRQRALEQRIFFTGPDYLECTFLYWTFAPS